MRTATHELETADGSMPLYEAVPDGAPRGAVVVIQEAYGVNDYIQSVAGRLAAGGYHAVAPHLFYRTTDQVIPYGDIAKAVEHLSTLTDDGLLGDVDAALDHLRGAGFDDRSIGTVGFCMGGRVTFLIAARRAIGAAAGFYGGGIVVQQLPGLAALAGEAKTLKAPWLGLFGDLDRSIPVEHVDQLREALKDAPVPTEIVRYPEAGHGFHCDRRDAFHPASAADGWRRTLAWFEEHIRR
jgi:carboxymethylenebutenolidase